MHRHCHAMMKDHRRAPSSRSLLPPPHVTCAGLLLALLCSPRGQKQLAQHVLVSAQQAPPASMSQGGLRREHGQGRHSSAIQSQLKQGTTDALHHWKDRSSFADVVVDFAVANAKGTTGTGTGTGQRSLGNFASASAASRDDAHGDDDKEQQQRRLSSKKSSKKHDEEDNYGDRWMLDMIGGSSEYTFGSNHIYNAYTIDDKYVDKKEKEEEKNDNDDDDDPVFTTDGDSTNRDGLHFMAPRSFEAPLLDEALHVNADDETATMTTTSCNPVDFVLPPSVQQAATAAQFPGPVHTFATVAALQGGFSPALRQYETPLVLRFTRLIDLLDWNCAASYSEDWRDALTFGDPLVRTPSDVNVTRTNSTADHVRYDLNTSDSRLLCMVHAWTAVTRFWIPEAVHPLLDVLNMLGLGQDIDVDLNFEPDVDQCFDISGMQTAWDDKEGARLREAQVGCGTQGFSPLLTGIVTGTCAVSPVLLAAEH